MCWPGANNIESGITLDLGLMNETTYDPETTTASIQPGPRWAEVYAYLEKGKHSKTRPLSTLQPLLG